jgi:FKBP-type peptidyl-prolyl cis-trans isomerase SlyD
MTISQDKVVSFHYDLKEADTQLETSRDGEPVLYLHGHQNLLPAMEAGLDGQAAGATLSLTSARRVRPNAFRSSTWSITPN